ncbi:NAD(P)/FAD-dependent oxidoreductase [Peribacillus asahii]|uniref:NAD(P)/FAD-dependent oxidoreductase n=1 Tax=Peribacillus asahii TaxID=228899 RepID=A0A398BDQ2_9BACI|nr:NAD(P)/FAD-dependent oxidoreductase [Peribacillus asahii]RID86948.1 NAD(P)/FAD-dependent oxidoreductase [Peribacillus asahii]
MKQVDCVIIGGGIAGLQAAIQLGRYKHDVLVIDSNQGRSTICRCYHNILGWPDGVSGQEIRKLGKLHAEKYGVQFLHDVVTTLKKESDHFYLETEQHATFEAKTIFLATGLVDHFPKLENLVTCLGTDIYVCPDCDGYEVSGKKTVVLGAGNTGADMAVTLAYWSNDIIYINHNQSAIDITKLDELEKHRIKIIHEQIEKIILDEKQHFAGVLLKNGEVVEAERGFIGFGGNKINYELAEAVGIELTENKHVLLNPRTKETNIKGVWAGGDLAAHSEQVTIAMGDGSQAAIWIHKRLLEQ